MKGDLSTSVSYVIGYRQSRDDRKQALIFLLKWLEKNLPGLEILLVEQDEYSKIDFPVPANCLKLFIHNAGFYNRAWAFNYALKVSNREILFFGDIDMFMSREDYLYCFSECKKTDVICPEGKTQKNIRITDFQRLKFEDLNNDRDLYTLSGGMVLFQRKAIMKIGGWIEEFEGWGAEDNAMDHLIVNKLKFKQLHLETYHIDHERTLLDGNMQPQYKKNTALAEEIRALNGKELTSYITKRKKEFAAVGDPYKYVTTINNAKTPLDAALTFVLAITTYNRLDYLKALLNSWERTRNNNVKWMLVIADDGSRDGTLEFLSDYGKKTNVPVKVINNYLTGVSHQFNTIVKFLSTRKFDLCFKVDDDIIFKKRGWDELYYFTIRETGMQHLVFYDFTWNLAHNIAVAKRNNLVSGCLPTNVQGAFFTITPDIIKKVGYMDTKTFGFRGYEHVDYSLRCARLGFNDPNRIFDVEHSNDFIELIKTNYRPSLDTLLYDRINTVDNFDFKRSVVVDETRTYIPFDYSDEKTGPGFIIENWRAIAKELNEWAWSLKDQVKELTEKLQRLAPGALNKEGRSKVEQSIESLGILDDMSEEERARLMEQYQERDFKSLIEENIWYKRELEKVINWHHAEMDKAKKWFETQLNQNQEWSEKQLLGERNQFAQQIEKIKQTYEQQLETEKRQFEAQINAIPRPARLIGQILKKL